MHAAKFKSQEYTTVLINLWRHTFAMVGNKYGYLPYYQRKLNDL